MATPGAGLALRVALPALAGALLFGGPAQAQFTGNGSTGPLRNLEMLKTLPGVRAAILEAAIQQSAAPAERSGSRTAATEKAPR